MTLSPLHPIGARCPHVPGVGSRHTPRMGSPCRQAMSGGRPVHSLGFLLAVLLSGGLLLTAGCGASEGKPGGGGGEGGPAQVDPSGRNTGSSQERLPPAGHAWVIFRSDTVLAEVARTPEARERGLMFRQEVPQGTGMLFVFPEVAIRSFWMRNTFVPLDIAFLDEHLVVVDIQAMEPQTEDLHQSARPAMFALEVPQGWFAEKGIRVGDTARVVFGGG